MLKSLMRFCTVSFLLSISMILIIAPCIYASATGHAQKPPSATGHIEDYFDEVGLGEDPLAHERGFASPEGPLNVERDLALGRSYAMYSTGRDAHMHHIEQLCFPDVHSRLTDGEVGSIPWDFRGAWVGFLRQDRRDIVIDLGRVRHLHQIDAWFLQDKSAGIRFPREVEFSVANRRGLWQTIASVRTKRPLSASHVLRQVYSCANIDVNARFARVTFSPDVWAFLSEIACWGNGAPSKGWTPVPSVPTPLKSSGYPFVDLTRKDSRHYQVLIYAGSYRPNRPQIGVWRPSSFLPYVGYLDSKAHIRGPLFDTFIFLPFSKAISGRSFADGTATKADWSSFMNHLFKPHQQLQALDEAVQHYNAATRDHRVLQVLIAIPYPGSRTDWSDDLTFDARKVGEWNSLQNRVAAVRWYVNEVKSRWGDAKLQHIRLTGFYWLPESLMYGQSPSQEHLVRAVSNVVHQAGPYTFDWIPFHQSEGFRQWRDLGFDTALMQPNYAWGGQSDRLAVTATLAKRYGLGVEMELDWPILSRSPRGDVARNKYRQYLQAACRFGYASSLTAWYQGYQVLLDCMQSKDPAIRRVYDDTYRFISGSGGEFCRHVKSSHTAVHSSRLESDIKPSSGYKKHTALPSGVEPDRPNPLAEAEMSSASAGQASPTR